MELKGQRVLVVGLGKSGISAARFLNARGARVTVSDSKAETELNEAQKFDEIVYNDNLPNHAINKVAQIVKDFFPKEK